MGYVREQPALTVARHLTIAGGGFELTGLTVTVYACKRGLWGYNGGMKFINFDAFRALCRNIGAALVIAGIVRAFLVVDPMGEPATVVIIGIMAALAGCIQKPKGGDSS